VHDALDLIDATIIRNPYIPWNPSALQALFLALPIKEALYGGAAGGGKSVALLMTALQYVHVPGYNALLLRRTFSDLELPGALIPLSHEFLHGTDAKWNGQDHRWTFPSGATISFGYLATENDKYRYQSSAFQLIGFDELTQFTRTQYTYLFSRCRRATSIAQDVPLRVRSASNPGNEGHEWVKRRFLDNPEGKRIFVPAKMSDNHGLDQASYREMLAELDPVTKAQLEHGDWNIRPEGNMFKREWFKIIPKAPADLLRTVRHWDIAGTTPSQENPDPDYIAGTKMSITSRNTFVIHNVRRDRLTPRQIEDLVVQTAKIDSTNVAISFEQEPGASGKLLIDHYARNLLPGFDVRPIRPTGNKVLRAGPFSAAAERGDVELVEGPWIEAFLDELCPFPDVPHDDQVDATSGAHARLTHAAAEWTAEDLGRVFQEPDPEGDNVKSLLLQRMRGQPDGSL
jgi:predicted phage terminase large subunit-like protein